MPDFGKIQRNLSRLIEADAPEGDIAAYLRGEGVTADEVRAYATRPPVGLDVMKAIPSGLAQGLIGAAAFPGDVANAAIGAFDTGQAPVPPSNASNLFQIGPTYKEQTLPPSPSGIPGSAEMRRYVEEHLTGPLYQAQTVPGQYAQTMASFAPNLASPGTLARRVVGGMVAPALASETAGQLTQGGSMEAPARIAGGVLGAIGGSAAVSALNAARTAPAGMSRGAGNVLTSTLGPDAERRLAELGPDAFLLEATPDTLGVAQGVVTRPGGGRGALVDAVTARQQGANARLRGETAAALGPYEDPAMVERALKAQRELIGKEYTAAVSGAQRLDPQPIVKALNREIDLEAGAPKKVLTEINGYLFKTQRFKDESGEWKTKSVLKTSAEELLNVRQAIDDLISRTTEPNALRLAVKYRAKIDDLMPAAVKDVDARFAELARQSDALAMGQASVLRTGPEAKSLYGLLTETADMSPGQRSMLRTGVRADIERIVGTKANDLQALRSAVGGEGDWNRQKLAAVFGQDAADRIMSSLDREAAFADAYRKLVENSQTAQRLGGAKLVEAETTRAPVMRDLTVGGAIVGGAQKAYRLVADSLKSGKRGLADDELARLLTTTGPERDAVVAAVREALARRAPLDTTRRAELIRALLGMEAATTPKRMREAVQ